MRLIFRALHGILKRVAAVQYFIWARRKKPDLISASQRAVASSIDYSNHSFYKLYS